jgi:rare lipoprotein A
MAMEPISIQSGDQTLSKKIETSIQKPSGGNFSEVLQANLEPGTKPPGPIGNKPVEYIVKQGDTLWKIARHFSIKDTRQIAKDNGLSNPNMIRPGQKLLIYSSSTHTVANGKGTEMTASWYGSEYHDKPTASGEKFDMHKNTLAHKSLPFGTRVRLVNPENGKVAEGVVNDRGPFIKNRQLDVSYALAKQLGFVKKGITKLNIEII